MRQIRGRILLHGYPRQRNKRLEAPDSHRWWANPRQDEGGQHNRKAPRDLQAIQKRSVSHNVSTRSAGWWHRWHTVR